ncbi:hypothetical protein [Paraburkholderia dinghuensis]|uniref:Fis family transcriptional regulator n=1 Tax=Paraburkholderia dinghuensis TaxID=2305225 RepID=A0A3N6MT19_9BURK|nr:hypothetical protein [Paraburkholderia dinghuensis]RQH07124.1 hypothetical protein D1Y85_10730 [Paraburkholderia dinghuensis]
MNRIGKRKSLTLQSRHNKALYLSMERSTTDSLVLPVRVALESVRRGHVERDAVVCLSEIVLLTGFLTQAGHGKLEQYVLDGAGRGQLPVLDAGEFQTSHELGPNTIEALTLIVNEYDRLLRETRLLAILDANERFERLRRSAMAIQQPEKI